MRGFRGHGTGGGNHRVPLKLPTRPTPSLSRPVTTLSELPTTVVPSHLGRIRSGSRTGSDSTTRPALSHRSVRDTGEHFGE